MSRALPPSGSTIPSRRSTLCLLESSKGPNCTFPSTPSTMTLDTDLTSLNGPGAFFGLLHSTAQNSSLFLIHVCLLRLCARSLAQRDQLAAIPSGTRVGDDAQRFPLATKNRSLSLPSASPEWGEDQPA